MMSQRNYVGKDSSLRTSYIATHTFLNFSFKPTSYSCALLIKVVLSWNSYCITASSLLLNTLQTTWLKTLFTVKWTTNTVLIVNLALFDKKSWHMSLLRPCLPTVLILGVVLKNWKAVQLIYLVIHTSNDVNSFS